MKIGNNEDTIFVRRKESFTLSVTVLKLSQIHPGILETLRTYVKMTDAEVVQCLTTFDLVQIKKKYFF